MFGHISTSDMWNNVLDLCILKTFLVPLRAIQPPCIVLVTWKLPMLGTIKCNTNGSAKGSPGHDDAGIIFRDHTGSPLGFYAKYIGINSSLHAESEVVIDVVDIAYNMGWTNVWIKCDSLLTVQAFKNGSIVPWNMQTRWRHCLSQGDIVKLHISHIFREGNCCANQLANFGAFSRSNHSWCDIVLDFNCENLWRDIIGLHSYRFC